MNYDRQTKNRIMVGKQKTDSWSVNKKQNFVKQKTELWSVKKNWIMIGKQKNRIMIVKQKTELWSVNKKQNYGR